VGRRITADLARDPGPRLADRGVRVRRTVREA
jgi:hypothetical protein